MLYFDIQLLKSDDQTMSLIFVIFTYLKLLPLEDLVLEVKYKSLEKWAF